MKVVDNFTVQQIEQVHQLYKTVWWAKDRTFEETQLCVRGSQVCLGIVNDQNQLIGFTRVISDFIYKAIIFDVIVSEAYRGKGIGQKLIQLVKNHQQLKTVKHFELYCVEEMEPFYERFDFSTEVGGIKLMRCINN